MHKLKEQVIRKICSEIHWKWLAFSTSLLSVYDLILCLLSLDQP